MKVPDSADPRVERTRAALRSALISLIIERGWDQTGIRDVCGRAGVGRSTFYTHFADKEDLLLSGYQDLRHMLRSMVGGPPLSFTRGLLEHAHENKRLFRALMGKKSSQVAQRHFLELMTKMALEDLPGVPAPVVHYVAGGFFQMMMWWLDSRSPLEPAALDAIFQKLTAGALSIARK